MNSLLIHLRTLSALLLDVVVSRRIRSRFAANFVRLIAYNGSGHLLTLLVAPILTRFYTPHDFGLFGIFLLFAAAAATAVCLNYDTAPPSVASDRGAATLALGAIIIAILLAPLIAGGYWLLVERNLLGFGVLPPWSSVLMWLFLLVAGVASVLQFWCVRTQHFAALGQASLAQSATRAITQGLCGLFGVPWGGLVAGEIAGRAATIGRLYRSAWRDIVGNAKHLRLPELCTTLVQHHRFASVLLPPTMTEVVFSIVTIAAINAMYDLATAGQYFLARRVLDVPLALLSRAIGDVFYGKVSEFRDQPDRIRALMIQVFIVVLMISVALLLPLALFGPPLFGVIFGESWRHAGLLAAVLTPATAMTLSVGAITRVFAVTKLPALRYVFTIAYAAGMTLVILAAWLWQLTILSMVIGVSIATVVAYVAYLVSAFVAAGHIETSIAQETGKQSS